MSGKIGAFAVAASLVVSGTAFAAATGNGGALPAGQPAGVKQAASFMAEHQMLWVVGGALVIGGIVLVATGNGHGSVASTCPLAGCTSTTTTTPTTTPTTTTTTTATTTTSTTTAP